MLKAFLLWICGRIVDERIPGAEFVVFPGEAHQPLPEASHQLNAMVDAFWTTVDSRG